MSFKTFFSKLFSKTTQAPDAIVSDVLIKKSAEDLKSETRSIVKNIFRSCEAEKVDSEICLHHNKDESPINFNHSRVIEILNEYNHHFFSVFKIDTSHYQIKINEDNVIVTVDDQDFSEALARSNKLSLSYEHIFLRLVQKEFKNFTGRLYLQSGDSKLQHQNYIKNLAFKLAKRVQKTGQKVSIPAKSSYERSVIHKVVATFPGLASKSVGPHHQRKLIIYSTKQKSKFNPTHSHAHK